MKIRASYPSPACLFLLVSASTLIRASNADEITSCKDFEMPTGTFLDVTYLECTKQFCADLLGIDESDAIAGIRDISGDTYFPENNTVVHRIECICENGNIGVGKTVCGPTDYEIEVPEKGLCYDDNITNKEACSKKCAELFPWGMKHSLSPNDNVAFGSDKDCGFPSCTCKLWNGGGQVRICDNCYDWNDSSSPSNAPPGSGQGGLLVMTFLVGVSMPLLQNVLG